MDSNAALWGGVVSGVAAIAAAVITVYGNRDTATTEPMPFTGPNTVRQLADLSSVTLGVGEAAITDIKISAKSPFFLELGSEFTVEFMATPQSNQPINVWVTPILGNKACKLISDPSNLTFRATRLKRTSAIASNCASSEILGILFTTSLVNNQNEQNQPMLFKNYLK